MLAFVLAFSFTTVQHWITTRGFYGGVAVTFFLLLACGLGLPLPEDIPLIIAGAFLCTDLHSWIITGIAAWCGIIGGDIILYSMGRRYGMEITRVPFIGKHITVERLESVKQNFEDYGVAVVAIGRMIAGIRGAMVVCAGTIRFNFLKFVIVDGLAAIVSGGFFMLVGHWIGEKLNDPVAQRKIHEFKEIVFFGAGFLLCGLIVFIFWRRRNVEKLHDVEQKVATKVMAAEKKVVGKFKKPPENPPAAQGTEASREPANGQASPEVEQSTDHTNAR